MLFSEPKIPQFTEADVATTGMRMFQCSSASRKFLNSSSIGRANRVLEFQCSSASRKFLNLAAVQQAVEVATFQCSSASRKFLNRQQTIGSDRIAIVSVLFNEPKLLKYIRRSKTHRQIASFSALQRAENSSIRLPNT